MLIQRDDQKSRTAMTVFAHPDDAEIACFGLLAKLRKQGWNVVMIVVTRGENGADPSRWDRMNEAQKAAASIDAKLVFGRFAEGYVPRSSELIGWMEDQLKQYRPELILTHFTGESRTAHQDHIAVEAAVQVAVRRANWAPTLLLAEGIDQDAGFHPNWFVDITDEFEQKLVSIGLHASQSGKYYMRPQYQILRARKWALNFLSKTANDEELRYWEAYYLAQHVI